MAARLKVFVTSDGLTDYIVAVSSKAKALAAWGVRQDLFKEGLAHETEDAALIKAASVRPGEVLRRPVGGGKLAALKAAPPPQPKGPSPAALKKVADLERRVAATTKAHHAALSDIDKKIAALQRDRTRIEAAQVRAISALEAQLERARAALG